MRLGPNMKPKTMDNEKPPTDCENRPSNHSSSVSAGTMAVKADAPGSLDEVHNDVLAESRQACYKARDAFYACVEKESDKKPTEIASVGLIYPAECKALRANFVKLCRASWVKHFDRKFCQNSRVQRLLDDKDSRRGPLILPQPYTFKPPN